MALLTTRDGAAVEPGTPLYWLEPGTTRVYEAETWTRDAAMQRWSSPQSLFFETLLTHESLLDDALVQIAAAEARHKRLTKRTQELLRVALGIPNGVAPDVTRVPPTDRPEAS